MINLQPNLATPIAVQNDSKKMVETKAQMGEIE